MNKILSVCKKIVIFVLMMGIGAGLMVAYAQMAEVEKINMVITSNDKELIIVVLDEDGKEIPPMKISPEERQEIEKNIVGGGAGALLDEARIFLTSAKSSDFHFVHAGNYWHIRFR